MPAVNGMFIKTDVWCDVKFLRHWEFSRRGVEGTYLLECGGGGGGYGYLQIKIKSPPQSIIPMPPILPPSPPFYHTYAPNSAPSPQSIMRMPPIPSSSPHPIIPIPPILTPPPIYHTI